MIKCKYCGRFVSYDDIDTGQAKLDYVPDTILTTEQVYYICNRCANEADVLRL